jgi:hypothetical protein
MTVLSTASSLHRLAAIGALHSPSAGFSQADMTYFAAAHALCRHAGFTFQTPLLIEAVNIADGWDFLDLRQTPAADLVITCLVNDLRGSDAALQGLGRRNAVSPYHRQPGAWYRAARRAGAKMIVTVSDALHCDEITTTAFRGRAFTPGPSLCFTAALAHNLSPPEPHSYRLDSLILRPLARALKIRPALLTFDPLNPRP